MNQCCAYRPFSHLAISDMSDNVYSRSSKSIFDFVTRHLCVQLFKTDQIKSTEVVLFWNIQVKLNHNFKHLQAKRKKCWISALMTTKCHWIFLKLVNILLILWISGNINFDSLIIDNRNIIFSTFIVDNRKIVSTKAQHWTKLDLNCQNHNPEQPKIQRKLGFKS